MHFEAHGHYNNGFWHTLIESFNAQTNVCEEV